MKWKGLKDHLEVGVVHPALYPQTQTNEDLLLPTIDVIVQDPYFDRVEIGGVKDPEILKQLQSRLMISRMKRTYLAQPKIFANNLDLNSLNKEERTKAIIELKKCLDEAVYIGADSMELASGQMMETQKEEAKKALVESLLEMDEYAQQKNIKLLLEIYDYDVDKRRLIGTTQDTVDVATQMEGRCPTLSFIVDLSHIPLQRETIEEAVFPLKNRIGHVHIGNCVMDEKDPRYGDKHPYFGYPNGLNDTAQVAYFLEALANIEYLRSDKKSSLSIEIMIGEGERAEDLIVNMKRTLNEAWDIFTSKIN